MNNLRQIFNFKTIKSITSFAICAVIGQDKTSTVDPLGQGDEERTAQVTAVSRTGGAHVTVGTGLTQAAETVLGDDGSHLTC